jgi:WD40 repeat protein
MSRILNVSLLIWSISYGCAISQARDPDFPSEENLRRGHIHRALFNRDGSLLVTASGLTSHGHNRYLVQFWNVETGELVRQFENHRSTISSIDFNPDETRLVTAGGNFFYLGLSDTDIRIWDAQSGERLLNLPGRGTDINQVEFSPDGASLLALSQSRNSADARDHLRVWDTLSWELKFRTTDVSYYAAAVQKTDRVQFTPDGKHLIGLASDGRSVFCRNATQGDELWRISQFPNSADPDNLHGFGHLRIDPESKKLAGICSDHTVRLWDLRTGAELQKFTGHTDRISTTAFQPELKRIVSAAFDQTIRVWDIETGRQLEKFDYDNPSGSSSINPTGTRMMSEIANPSFLRSLDKLPVVSGTMWDLTTGRKIRDFELTNYGRVVFHPDGKRVFLRSHEEGPVMLDINTGAIVKHYGEVPPVD